MVLVAKYLKVEIEISNWHETLLKYLIFENYDEAFEFIKVANEILKPGFNNGEKYSYEIIDSFEHISNAIEEFKWINSFNNNQILLKNTYKIEQEILENKKQIEEYENYIKLKNKYGDIINQT